ncbi:hypothetical protein [Paenibacillus sp. GM2]|uniref:hypothetical protein n=1 Tax=Paenibacillus sp. GM2 TaxID=1622070 RepID=UPI000837AE39|nr:hypothetical protein [Paenibacillus sp. GM2]
MKLRYNELSPLRIRSKQGFGTMLEITIPIEEDRHGKSRRTFLAFTVVLTKLGSVIGGKNGLRIF